MFGLQTPCSQNLPSRSKSPFSLKTRFLRCSYQTVASLKLINQRVIIVVIMIKPVFEKLLIELSLVLGVQGEGETIASHCGPAAHLRSSISLFVRLSTRWMLIGPKVRLRVKVKVRKNRTADTLEWKAWKGIALTWRRRHSSSPETKLLST